MSIMSVDEIKHKLEVAELKRQQEVAERESRRERKMKRVISFAFGVGAFAFVLVNIVMLLATLAAVKFMWGYLWQ